MSSHQVKGQNYGSHRSNRSGVQITRKLGLFCFSISRKIKYFSPEKCSSCPLKNSTGNIATVSKKDLSDRAVYHEMIMNLVYASSTRKLTKCPYLRRA